MKSDDRLNYTGMEVWVWTLQRDSTKKKLCAVYFEYPKKKTTKGY